MQLIRAIREGAAALPGDLDRLCAYMSLIGRLLEEKANELEPSWEAACAMAKEIETLQLLESAVAERAVGTAADTLAAVRSKLAIWKALSEGSEEEPRTPRNRLILSIEDDLQRLALQAAL
ncbi:MAG TPA: hypothetical protein VM422_07415 [Amaricoccus sp.]|nr:hypothetical protein [Amaricoccus sp.]